MQRRYCIAAAAVVLSLLAGAGRQPTTTTKPKTSPFGGSSFSIPSGPGSAPASPAATTPPAPEAPGISTVAGVGNSGASEVANAYFATLAAGHPYKAVDECFDINAFARRVFKGDMNKLESSDAAYLRQLCSVFVKTAVTVNDAGSLRSARRSDFKTFGEGDELTLTCIVTTSATGPREMKLIVCRSGSGWKIVDINSMGKIATDAYAKLRVQSPTPVIFMESMLGGLIHSKIEKIAPGSTDAGAAQQNMQDAMRENLRAQLQGLSNQIELYKARTGRYPDLLAHGWSDLIKGRYINKAPVNPVNGHSEICAGTKGQADFGWYWDAKSGTLGACYYDEKTAAVTPDTP